LKLLLLFTLFGSLLFPTNADHLLLTRVVTQPTSAESFSIYNPTNSVINLSDYYICDDEDYYKMQTEGDMAPSHFINGFTARFPDINIDPNDTLTIVLNLEYIKYYGEDFVPDLAMYLDQDNSMIETEEGSFGKIFSDEDGDPNTTDDINPVPKLNDNEELLILFYWDGNPSSPIQDVDYFVWSSFDGVEKVVDKTGIDSYADDTALDNQWYFNTMAGQYYAYSRIGIDEIDEIQNNGNGINGHDETSENFRVSWEVIEIFEMGCTDPDAPNYNEAAEFDDGSCYIPFSKIISGVYDCGINSRDACEDGMPSSDVANCQLVNIEGKIVSFGDYSYANGPYALVVEDEEGYRLELTIWPDTWNILLDENYSILTEPPFFDFVVKAYGNVFTYNGKRQVYVCGPTTIEITQTYNTSGIFIPSDATKTAINPEPFILIPTLGENLNFTYTFPENSRVIIRIYDLSGRFITSLEDKYFEEAGTVVRNNLSLNEYGDGINSSAWDGRDQLGQIVAPGTYIMHIEAMNPVTGETQTDAAPIVVGVKN
jgi:hypothetical protein